MHVSHTQDTLDKMIRAFPGRKKLKGARNYCEVGVLGPHVDEATGAPQPPGGWRGEERQAVLGVGAGQYVSSE